MITMVDPVFWRDKKVLITGHTGFKGAWLCLWLHHLGAKVTGYALSPPTNPSIFECAQISSLVDSIIDDVRSKESVQKAINQANPDIIIHMAAQPLVRLSYQYPAETYEINVMGTVNVLEAARVAVQNGMKIRAIINVTTDKVYENREWVWGYREQDVLGGYDPYSNSKACSEQVTASYRNAFFHPDQYHQHGVAIASARAGNVIGGGDWALDRLIPDCLSALMKGEKIIIRSPKAIRPWQHVLEPLKGYLMLAEKMWRNGKDYAQSWNFGPNDEDAKSVEWIVRQLCERWGAGASFEAERTDSQWHEAQYLKLDCSKARSEIDWKPNWSIEQTLDSIISWHKAYQQKQDVRKICLAQIRAYTDGPR
ncbi:CDP-glucose 4,6-dehydratase [Brevibacillus brevis]|nr:CDP-glucose 4,6-dehydratase [Brevibacillus brevis]VEF90446.1 CDP-glucose 4,6-dehydratase [Brevibacillus brevis]